MLTYINFKFNLLTKYHSQIVEDCECSHQDVSQAIYNIRVRVVSGILLSPSARVCISDIQHGRSCCKYYMYIISSQVDNI